MTIAEKRDIIKKQHGRIFSVIFTKKDGADRKMTCRLGVKKHLKGGTPAYDPSEYDLLWVFDIEKNAYRSVNLATIKQLHVDGQVIVFE